MNPPPYLSETARVLRKQALILSLLAFFVMIGDAASGPSVVETAVSIPFFLISAIVSNLALRTPRQKSKSIGVDASRRAETVTDIAIRQRRPFLRGRLLCLFDFALFFTYLGLLAGGGVEVQRKVRKSDKPMMIPFAVFFMFSLLLLHLSLAFSFLIRLRRAIKGRNGHKINVGSWQIAITRRAGVVPPVSRPQDDADEASQPLLGTDQTVDLSGILNSNEGKDTLVIQIKECVDDYQ